MSDLTLTRFDQIQVAEIEYPESDGKPMTETDVHYRVMIALRFALEERYREDDRVYVAGNLMMYYQEGNLHACLSPDVFVAFGISKRERRVYKIWEEGKGPDVVFEITSKSTRTEDLADKRWLYEELGVQEYFLFDPLCEYLRPHLQGFRREGLYLAPLAAQSLPDDEWQLFSQVLGVKLRTEGSLLRLFDFHSGERLYTPQEEAQARRAEAQARRVAEQRVQSLEKELARLRGEK